MHHPIGTRIGCAGVSAALFLSLAACGGGSGTPSSAAPSESGSASGATQTLEVWLPAKATDGNDAEIWMRS